MNREIVLSSYSVKNIPGNSSSNFIIVPSNNEYQLGLNRIISISFSWFNFNPSYKNQTITYSVVNGVNFQNLVFPAGVRNYKDFDSYLKQTIGNNNISLTFNSTTFRVTIKLPVRIRLDLTKSDFNDLIGFDKKY